ncbi:MAG: type II secretion system F family protein [Candidatus Aenigmarchaeota archaeon]|nr:type II secretion system F family protein [Candidatus Aenigmarchaeota archaeon]
MMKRIKHFANKTFGWIYDKYSVLFEIVRDSLPKANMRIPARTYISLGFFYSTMAYVLSFLFVAIYVTLKKLPVFSSIAMLIFIPTIIAVISFLTYMFIPYYNAEKRKRDIETNLPFAIAHMGAIAGSGIPPQAIFKLLSKFKEYGELSKEMEKITRNIEVFGMDPVTAVKEVAKTTPSESLKEVLMGFVTTTQSGGDIKVFLQNAGKQAMFEWQTKRKRFVEQLATYAEFYTGLLIAAPLFVISLFSVMNMISGKIGGIGILQLMKISIYVFIPLLNIGFLLFLHATQVEM